MRIILGLKIPGGEGLEGACSVVNAIALLILVPFQVFPKWIVFYFKGSSFFYTCILTRRLLQDLSNFQPSLNKLSFNISIIF